MDCVASESIVAVASYIPIRAASPRNCQTSVLYETGALGVVEGHPSDPEVLNLDTVLVAVGPATSIQEQSRIVAAPAMSIQEQSRIDAATASAMSIQEQSRIDVVVLQKKVMDYECLVQQAIPNSSESHLLTLLLQDLRAELDMKTLQLAESKRYDSSLSVAVVPPHLWARIWLPMWALPTWAVTPHRALDLGTQC